MKLSWEVCKPLYLLLFLVGLGSAPGWANEPASTVIGEILANNTVNVTSLGVAAELNDGDSYILFPDDVIKTGPSSQASLTIDGLGSLQVAPSSEVAIHVDQGSFMIDVTEGGIADYKFDQNANFEIRVNDITITAAADQPSVNGALTIDEHNQLYLANLSGQIILTNEAGERSTVDGDSLVYTGPASLAKGPLYAQPGVVPAVDAERSGNDCDDEEKYSDDDCEGAGAFLLGGTGVVTTGTILAGSGGALLVPIVGVSAAIALGPESGDSDDDQEPASP